jgi:hypothetical protein
MKMKILKFTQLILLIALLLIASHPAFGQAASCQIINSFHDVELGIFSSNFQVGNLLLQPDDDDTDNEISKIFLHQESGVKVVVSVWISSEGIKKSKTKSLKLALAFNPKSDDLVGEGEGAEAESVYDKHWKWLSVSNQIKVGSRVYTFTLSCTRESKKRNR